PILRMLLAAGLDVFAPNVLGSTGYGIRYFSLDDKELRWDSVRDGCEAARWLKREGLATKTAAMGGSYGGFMTLAVLVERPGLWRRPGVPDRPPRIAGTGQGQQARRQQGKADGGERDPERVEGRARHSGGEHDAEQTRREDAAHIPAGLEQARSGPHLAPR